MDNPTISYSFRADPVLVVVITEADIDPVEWETYIVSLKLFRPKKALVWSSGWSPSPQHRSDLLAAVSDGLKVAVVSPAVTAIPALEALNLFLRGFRQFSPDQLSKAMQFLGIPAENEEWVREVMSDTGWPGVPPVP